MAEVATNVEVDRWWRDRVALVLGSGLTFVLLLDLGGRSLWADEGNTAEAKLRPLGEFVERLWRGEAANALYYSLQRILPFGTSEFALRLPSAVAAGAAVVVTVRLARRLFDARAAWIAGALLVVHGVVHHYGQEARAYALAMLATAGATWCLVDAVESGGRKRWLRYGVLAAAATYLHLFAGLVVAAHLAALVLARPERPSERGTGPTRRLSRTAAIALGAVAVAALPFVPFLRAHNRITYWIPPLTTDRFVNETAEVVTGWPNPTLLWVIVALWAAGGVALVRANRRATFGETLVIAWVAVPVVLAVVITVVHPVFVARYLTVIVPGVALLTAAAVTRLRDPLPWAAAAVALVVTTMGLLDWRADTGRAEKQDWRAALAAVEAEAEPGDVLVLSPRWLVHAYTYYGPKFDLEGVIVTLADPGSPPLGVDRITLDPGEQVFVIRTTFTAPPALRDLPLRRVFERQVFEGSLVLERFD